MRLNCRHVSLSVVITQVGLSYEVYRLSDLLSAASFKLSTTRRTNNLFPAIDRIFVFDLHRLTCRDIDSFR